MAKDKKKDVLLKIQDLRIEAYADEKWFEIVHGVDLTLHRGEVLGLIGESGAGKSTIGLAAMGFARDGCRISGGSIEFDEYLSMMVKLTGVRKRIKPRESALPVHPRPLPYSPRTPVGTR